MTPEERLHALGLEIPPVPPTVANYVGAVQVGTLLFVAGHGPFKDGKPTFIGKLGREFDVEQGKESAQLVALNMLATIKDFIGELDRVEKVVKLLVLVNSDPEFGEQPQVANGASDLLVEIFGEKRGKHARSAIGMGALPFGISVEIEGIFELREEG
jgi:enamine deaminase RidA (YjgF/YER057c/UK114 family)